MEINRLNKSVNKFTLITTNDFRISGELQDKNLFLHLDYLVRWSPSVYKQLLFILTDIKHSAHKLNITDLYVLVPLEFIKFESLFGFEPEQILHSQTLNKDYILMSQKVN